MRTCCLRITALGTGLDSKYKATPRGFHGTVCLEFWFRNCCQRYKLLIAARPESHGTRISPGLVNGIYPINHWSARYRMEVSRLNRARPILRPGSLLSLLLAYVTFYSHSRCCVNIPHFRSAPLSHRAPIQCSSKHQFAQFAKHTTMTDVCHVGSWAKSLQRKHC